MTVLTRQDQANSSARRWALQYRDRARPLHDGKHHEEIYHKLVSLSAMPTPQQVNEIIGNDSWTRLECSCCEQEVEK